VAGRLLEQVLDGYKSNSPDRRYRLAVDLAFYRVRHCQDPVQGCAWLKFGREGSFGPHTRLRVEAARWLAEGQPELAGQKAREGLDAVAEFYDRGLAMAEAEGMQAMIYERYEILKY
jgi:hypothetical protein